MMQEGLNPGDVTGDNLRQYGIFLATQMVGVRIEPMLPRIVQLWRRAAASHSTRSHFRVRPNMVTPL